MESSPITRDRRRPKKNKKKKKLLGKTIKKDLDLHGWIVDMVYDKILQCCIIHIANQLHLVGYDLIVIVVVVSILVVLWACLL